MLLNKPLIWKKKNEKNETSILRKIKKQMMLFQIHFKRKDSVFIILKEFKWIFNFIILWENSNFRLIHVERWIKTSVQFLPFPLNWLPHQIQSVQLLYLLRKIPSFSLSFVNSSPAMNLFDKEKTNKKLYSF